MHFKADSESPTFFLCVGCNDDVKELFSLSLNDNLTEYISYKRAFLEDFHNSVCACKLVLAADSKRASFYEKIDQLKASGKTGYYEYKVISVVDERGVVNADRLTDKLNKLGLEGWRLQCAYSNEMGKNALSIAGIGANATADQNILILERFVNI